jgi:hypothetical protein
MKTFLIIEIFVINPIIKKVIKELQAEKIGFLSVIKKLNLTNEQNITKSDLAHENALKVCGFIFKYKYSFCYKTLSLIT